VTTRPNPLTTEIPLTSLTGDQLRARVARAQLYLLHFSPAPGAPTPSAETLQRQLWFLNHLEATGFLYGYGSLGDAATPGGPALGILAAASREQAEATAAEAPLCREGLHQVVVQGHTMNEGVSCYVGRALSHRAIAQAGANMTAGDDRQGLATSSGAAAAQLHLIHLIPTNKPRAAEDTQTGYDHFIWLRENEMKAKLMSCGPVDPATPLAPGIWGGGLGVVAVGRAEAEAIAAAEPSGKAGYRTLRVEPWHLQHGVAAPIGRALAALNALP